MFRVVCLSMIGVLLGQLLLFIVLGYLEGMGFIRFADVWAAASNRLSATIYWGTLGSGLLGCVLGYVIGRRRDKGSTWY